MYFEYKCFKNGFKRYIYVDIYLVCGRGFCKHPPVSPPTACTLTPIVVDSSLSLVVSRVGRRISIDRRQSEKQLQREDAKLRVTPAAANDIQSYFLADTPVASFTPAPPAVPHDVSLCSTFLEASKPAEWKRRKILPAGNNL